MGVLSLGPATSINGAANGPEFGISQFGGTFKQDNVMLLKSCRNLLCSGRSAQLRSEQLF